LWVRKLNILITLNISVHFVLKQNEPKVQGCEKIVGGHGVFATFYQWSITLKAC